MIGKNRIWMMVLFFAVLTLLPVHAEKYYVLTAHLAGQQAIVSSVKMENVPVEVSEGDGEYLIEVVSMYHEVLYSGRYGLGSSPAPLYIPYDIEGNYLNIKKSTGEVLQRVSVALFSSVCGDGLCQSSETAQTCKADCPLSGSPSVQETRQEGESETQKEGTKPAQEETPAPIPAKQIIKKPAKKSVGKIILIGGVLGVVLASGGFWVMLKKSKEQRLGQIQNYMRKYASYPQDQVRRALLARGIREEDIEEALRQN